MLAKKQRLTAAQVREILKTGRSARSATLSAKYLRGAGAAAVVVSSKVAKTAVSRNRLRRAAYRILRGALPKDVRAVFFLHKPALDLEELKALCLKLS
jgi:ribonuclease P protein component